MSPCACRIPTVRDTRGSATPVDSIARFVAFAQVPKQNFRNGALFGLRLVAHCLQGRSELKYGTV
jgi:hypothetical protein